ncbi:hypothetical protein QO179_24195 [Bacillus stercoris]|nr:hypothetical protein [Bacillus stercoris]
MRVVEAIISEVVQSHAIVLLDNDGHIVEVQEIIEESARLDPEVISIEKDIEAEEDIEDHREV